MLADELLEVYVVQPAIDEKIRPVMAAALAVHPRTEPGLAQQFRDLEFEYASADAALNILARTAFQDNIVDSGQMQQMREHQTGRPGADDSDTCSADGHGEFHFMRLCA
jgi:hypothetical protein